MAAIATQDPTGGIANVRRGPLHAQVPQRPGPLPSRVLHPDEQLQRNHPFYTPSVQPLFPYQWSMSTPYVPYGGLQGLGYGMMMPSLLLPQCLEVPGYMFPQSQMHMLDYRRMTPHVAPTIAHQTHFNHFQNGVPPGRVMVSAEVQTEPFCDGIDSHEHAISRNGSESGRGTGSPLSTSPSSLDNKSVAYAAGTSTLTQNFIATNAINTTDLSGVPKTEILQAERIQMKCNTLPAELNFQNKNNTELASHNETDLLQCSLGSIQSSGDVVLCSYQSLAFRKDKQSIESGMLRYSRKHCIPACTTVAMMRTSPSCRTFKTYPKPSRSIIHKSINKKRNSDNMDFKILRLPLDLQNHEHPCQLEASVWSVESLIPYVPSTDFTSKNGLLTPLKPLSPLNEHAGVITKPHYVAEGKNLQPVASANYHGRPCSLEASIWSVESLMPHVPSNEWMVENGLLTPQKRLNPQIKPSNVLSKQKRSSTGIRAGKNVQPVASAKYHGHPCPLEASMWSVESLKPYVPSNEWMVENELLTPQKRLNPQMKPSNVLSTQKHSFTGFQAGKKPQIGASYKHDSLNTTESCSPYRPSTSWLADFGNVYYYSKLPVVRQQPDLPEKQLPKMSLAASLESPPFTNGKKHQRTAISSSDLMHCSFSTCKCKAESSLRLAGSAMKCSLMSHSTVENKLPFCPSCKYDVKGKDHRRPSFSDGFREETTEENIIYMKMGTGGCHGTPKMSSGSHSEKCCGAYQAKLSERTRLCEDCQCLNPNPAQDKGGDLRWRILEKSEEDWINNPNQRSLQRMQKDNSWKASMQVSKNERRIQKKERKGYSQEKTHEENTMFMATSSQCAHPMESEKAH